MEAFLVKGGLSHFVKTSLLAWHLDTGFQILDSERNTLFSSKIMWAQWQVSELCNYQNLNWIQLDKAFVVNLT